MGYQKHSKDTNPRVMYTHLQEIVTIISQNQKSLVTVLKTTHEFIENSSLQILATREWFPKNFKKKNNKAKKPKDLKIPH